MYEKMLTQEFSYGSMKLKQYKNNFKIRMLK